MVIFVVSAWQLIIVSFYSASKPKNLNSCLSPDPTASSTSESGCVSPGHFMPHNRTLRQEFVIFGAVCHNSGLNWETIPVWNVDICVQRKRRKINQGAVQIDAGHRGGLLNGADCPRLRR
jgi:hypothetical protein